VSLGRPYLESSDHVAGPLTRSMDSIFWKASDFLESSDRVAGPLTRSMDSIFWEGQRILESSDRVAGEAIDTVNGLQEGH
jgi:hypothetical protein